jgi:hypothetical protein
MNQSQVPAVRPSSQHRQPVAASNCGHLKFQDSRAEGTSGRIEPAQRLAATASNEKDEQVAIVIRNMRVVSFSRGQRGGY